MAWVLPPLALLFGVGLVAAVLARRSRLPRPVTGPEIDAEQEARLREAMRVLDEDEAPEF